MGWACAEARSTGDGLDHADRRGDDARERRRVEVVRRERSATESLLSITLMLDVFLVFFVAPLVQLLVLSLHNDTAGTVWGIGQYVHFLTDPFSLSVLGSTLLLGAEVTALCLVLGLPIAWLYHRVAGHRRYG